MERVVIGGGKGSGGEGGGRKCDGGVGAGDEW